MVLGFIAAAALAQAGASPFQQQIKKQFQLIARHQPFPEKVEEPKPEKKRGDKEDTDNPWEAVQWLRKTLLDDSGQLPPNGFKVAYAQRAANIAYHQLMFRRPGINPNGAGSSSPPWISVGPDNIGGRTRSLVVMPGGTTLIAGSVSGGIWKSTNGGSTWAPINDQMANLNIDCITQDPNNTNHLLAGTGEAFFNGDADSGDGIWQSTDGGNTWAQMATTANLGNVAKIAFCPTNSNDILAATVYNGIWQSTDGGNTWTNVYNAQGAMDVKFSPWDSTRAVADILNYNFTINSWTHQAFYSTNSGATWQACSGIPVFNDFNARMSFDFSHTTQNLVYCVSGNNGGQVWTSTDDGQTFASVSGTGLFAQTWYNNFILVDPTNDANSFIPNGPLKSTNSGASYAAIASGYIMTQDPHPDVHLGLVDPGFNGTSDTKAYFTTDGGIFDTSDIYTAAPGTGWSSLNQGYVTGQFYSAEGDSSGIFFGGMQDNGSPLLKSGNTNASLVFGGDGGFVNIDHTNTNNLYGEYVDLQIFASHDGGNSSNYIYGGISDAGSNANFIAPIMLDPNNPDTLLAGGASVWRTTNANASNFAPTWTAIRSPGSDKISTIAIAAGDSTDIWVGQNDGGIGHTSNGTAATPTWTNSFVSVSGSNVTRYVQNITIDPNNHNRIFVAFGGLQSNPLYESIDGGNTWASASGTGNTALPAAPVRYLSIHPDDSNWLFAGTAVGLFESMDGGTTWSTSDDGPASVDTWDTRFIPGTSTILIGTHGRGLWTQNEVAVQQVSLGATSVTAGMPVSGTVYLIGQGDANGLNVNLQSSNTSVATVPPSVSVANGASSAPFTVTTLSASTATSVTITATIGTTSQTASVTVNPGATLSNFYASPTSFNDGQTTHGVVQIASAAGTGGQVIQLAGTNAAIVTPSSVTIPAGSKGVSFTITSTPVSAQTSSTVTATLGSTSKQATITLNPYAISNFYASPSSLAGGLSGRAVIQLAGKAGPSGDSVAIQSGSASVQVPASVTVPAGTTGVSFTFTSSGVNSSASVTLTATFAAASSSTQTTVTLNPATLLNFYTSPATLTGGTVTYGVAQLSGTAGPSGDVVSLQSSSGDVIVPTSITEPANKSGVSFALNTKPVSANENVTLTATFGSSSKQATVTLKPYGVSSFYANPSSVKGGTTSHGVVQLAGKAGPSGNVVSLQSSSALAVVPASVTVPAGTTGVSFLITTSAVTTSTPVTLTATFNGVQTQTTVTLTP